jgi:Holliday junction resolvase RusA-like endonuclease
VNTITFTVHGKPQQKGSKQPVVNKRKDGSSFAGMKDMNPKARGWQDAVSAAAAEAFNGRELIRSPVKLSVVFRFTRPKSHYGTGRNSGTVKASSPQCYDQTPDLDKLVRVVADGLEHVILANDKQICEYGKLRKEWTTGGAQAMVTVDLI